MYFTYIKFSSNTHPQKAKSVAIAFLEWKVGKHSSRGIVKREGVVAFSLNKIPYKLLLKCLSSHIILVKWLFNVL